MTSKCRYLENSFNWISIIPMRRIKNILFGYPIYIFCAIFCIYLHLKTYLSHIPYGKKNLHSYNPNAISNNLCILHPFPYFYFENGIFRQRYPYLLNVYSYINTYLHKQADGNNIRKDRQHPPARAQDHNNPNQHGWLQSCCSYILCGQI